jgi:peptidase M49-like protein
MRAILCGGAVLAAISMASCTGSAETPAKAAGPVGEAKPMTPTRTKYVEVALTSDLYAKLSEKERAMIPLLIDAARDMDAIFWREGYGDKDKLLASIADPESKRFAEINYGPWDRLQANAPFVPGAGEKPKGAAYYPADMTKDEFDKACAAAADKGAALKSPYTIVKRDPSGRLVAVPYHEAFAAEVKSAAAKLTQAAALAEDAGLRSYLELRARALLDDDYRPSDLAWMDMKTNGVDIVIGPIENYEDALFGIKNTHEGYVLIKDRDWSARLAKYAKFLPELQRGLPVPDAYKKEKPGTDSDLNAYDAVFYAGDCNAGSKTIAINLPNDEEVQLKKGTRRLQLKNAMRAKFDQILTPIADRLIAPEQRPHVKFDSFFENVMFHEVAHGLGIKATINGKGSVREALKEQAGALEEGKADVLGLYMVAKLKEKGELGEADLMDNFVTYLAGIFRSVRFGATEAHGRSNLAQFAFFQQMGAFTRDAATGTYRVDFAKMQAAMNALSEKILKLQGDGDLDGVVRFLPKKGEMDPTLAADLERLRTADIPTDIVFRQGMEVLQGSGAAAAK